MGRRREELYLRPEDDILGLRSTGGVEYPLRLPRPSDEHTWFFRGVIIGADGSVLRNGDRVYVISVQQLRRRVLTINRFHTFYPSAGGSAAVFKEVHRRRDRFHVSRDMILLGRHTRAGACRPVKVGFVVQRIIHVQRRFRARLQAREVEGTAALVGDDASPEPHRRRLST